MRIQPAIEPELTPALVYLRGEFALWRYKIPYFTSVVPLSFVIDKFSLIDDIPDAERLEWSLEELFQRDISWERIDEELVKYLRNENRPQFFNALTVALLPRMGHGFAGTYVERQKYPPISGDDLEGPVQVGGVQIQAYKGSDGLAGKLRWDKKEVIAVAVDGQHRLAAMKEIKKLVKPEQLDGSSVPVIFIVPHESMGFVEPPQPHDAGSVISPLRRVFIDLNKNARQVSRVRSILLDDQDVVSVCTRLLIGEKLSPKVDGQRIPLPLVDWVSEKIAKIETGPFLTNVLLLYEFVGAALNIDELEEPEEEEDQDVRQWLVATFAPSDEQLEALMLQVRRSFNQGVPLTFLPSDIATLSDLFVKRWRPLLYRVFSELKPFKDLWKYGADQTLHKPEFVNLYVANEILEGEHGRERALEIENAIRAGDPDWNRDRCYTAPLEHIDTKIKNDHWAFKVVFQRGLFRSYLDLLAQAESFVVDEGSSEEKKRDQFTTLWIEALNALFDNELALTEATFSRPRERFWAGIGLRSDNTIDFTNAGSTRIRRWLNAWACIHGLSDELPDYGALKEDERHLVQMIANNLEKRPVRRGMEALADARNQSADPEQIDTEAQKLLVARYNHLRKLARE